MTTSNEQILEKLKHSLSAFRGLVKVPENEEKSNSIEKNLTESIAILKEAEKTPTPANTPGKKEADKSPENPHVGNKDNVADKNENLATKDLAKQEQKIEDKGKPAQDSAKANDKKQS